jgi:hypothetical protein
MRSKDEVVCIHQGFWLITNGGGFVQGPKPQYGQIYVVKRVEDGLWLEGFPAGSWAAECFIPLSEWSISNMKYLLSLLLTLILFLISCNVTVRNDSLYVVDEISKQCTTCDCIYEDNSYFYKYLLPCGMYQIGDTIKPPAR